MVSEGPVEHSHEEPPAAPSPSGSANEQVGGALHPLCATRKSWANGPQAASRWDPDPHPSDGLGRRVCPPTPTPGTRPSGQSRPLTGLPLVGECILHKRHAGRPQGIRNTRPSQLGVPASLHQARGHLTHRAEPGRDLKAGLRQPPCPHPPVPAWDAPSSVPCSDTRGLHAPPCQLEVGPQSCRSGVLTGEQSSCSRSLAPAGPGPLGFRESF